MARLSRPLRENLLVLLGSALGLLGLGWLSLYGYAWNDYDIEASRAVHELVSGHTLAFLQQAPSYGGSLLIRAPFALAANLWHGGGLADYRMLAAASLLPAGALAVALARRLRAADATRLCRATVVALLVANPVMMYGLQIGHSEEILAGSLGVAALLAAGAQRPLWAGLLVGLAVGTKTSASVALLPVILTLAPGQRGRAATLAVATAGVVLMPFLIAQRLHSGGAGVAVASSGALFQPEQAWWFLGRVARVIHGYDGRVHVGWRQPPAWLPGLAHPLIVVLALPLTLAWQRRRAARPAEPLALLALLLLLRCLLDPWNNYYYSIPFLFALTAFEVVNRHRVPVLALTATAAEWFCFQKLLQLHASPDLATAVYLAWTIVSATLLSAWLYAPARWDSSLLALRSRPWLWHGGLVARAEVSRG